MYFHKSGYRLRKAEKKDLTHIKSMRDESLMTVHSLSFTSMAEQERWFEHLLNSSDLAIVGESPDGKFYGLAYYYNINHINRTLDISAYIAKDVRGSREELVGFFHTGVDFAFEMLNVNRINAEVLENNIAAISLEMSIGFRVEGRKRDAVYKSGRYFDSLVLGLLKSEWEESQHVKNYEGICNTNTKFHTKEYYEKFMARYVV